MGSGEKTLYEVTLDGNRIHGPASLAKLQRSVASGNVPQTAFARVVGTLEWRSIGQFLDIPPAVPAIPQPTQLPAPTTHLPRPIPVPGKPSSPSPPLEVVQAQLAPPVAQQSAPRIATADEIYSAQLQQQIQTYRNQLAGLQQQLHSVEEAVEMQSFGFYRPKYGFDSSKNYATILDGIREDQKRMVKYGTAAKCNIPWQVDGSAAKGKRMVDLQIKLMLRAFNGECDAAIAKVRYDNIVSLEKRLVKSFHDVNKLGESQQSYIDQNYLNLKIAELSLVHEHREKVQEEKEEQKRIREQMREEARAAEEIERVLEDAERDERVQEKALKKAREELAKVQGANVTSATTDKLESLVKTLESRLSEALDRKAKAIARAQLTKSGHVYVLSNIGSFGEGVYKIGLTRRLDPYERVEELGGASVPFPFDVHAIIFTENAPALEHALHQEFADRRINTVNNRKEYFQVTLDEIRTAVQRLHGLVTFLLEPEAEQYRKTIAFRESKDSDRVSEEPILLQN